MKNSRIRAQFHTENRDKGFSLIEVLVCIAVLVIICVPLFTGMQIAAGNTKRSHSTQMVTEYAQQVLETIRSVEVEEFKSMIISAPLDESGNPTGSVSTAVNTTQQAEFDSTYPDSLFTVITCEQSDIRIGGELYDMEVMFDPNDYSAKKDPAISLTDDTPANDVNVYTVTGINAIDGAIFSVISDEINKHEGNGDSGLIPGAVLYNLLGQLKNNQLSVFGADDNERLETIYGNTKKTVKITISENGTENLVTFNGRNYITNSLKVVCDVIYETEHGGISIKQSYNVFSGTYNLRGLLNETDDTIVEEWEAGGNIYIFAKAWQDQFYYTPGGINNMPKLNVIEIDNQYTGRGKLNINLVRGYYWDVDGSGNPTNKRGLHFDEVYVDTDLYAAIPTGINVPSGEKEYGKTCFKTNIKGAAVNRVLSAADMEQTIGIGKHSLRCYSVTLRLTEQSTSREVINMTTTKIVR